MGASVRVKESAPALLDGQYVFTFILNLSVLLNIQTKDYEKTVLHCKTWHVPCFHSDRSSLVPVRLLYHTLVCMSPGVLVIYLNILVCKFVCVSQTDKKIFHQWDNK